RHLAKVAVVGSNPIARSISFSPVFIGRNGLIIRIFQPLVDFGYTPSKVRILAHEGSHFVKNCQNIGQPFSASKSGEGQILTGLRRHIAMRGVRFLVGPKFQYDARGRRLPHAVRPTELMNADNRSNRHGRSRASTTAPSPGIRICGEELPQIVSLKFLHLTILHNIVL
ncbi:MAG TPA: hypothetical protein PLZ95_12980, partial [Bryobacteraceae bacterium]|nr:hypothetical protein [Bryobacteraceae bacterium]